MSDHLEFRLLKYIVAVAETANFTRASERLFLAQPTLSQQVIALEEAIGVRIFVRRREGIHLTPAGQMLYAYAQEMLDLRDEVVSAARAMDRREIPALRIGLDCQMPLAVRCNSSVYSGGGGNMAVAVDLEFVVLAAFRAK